MEERFSVNNVKCQGCATAICSALSALPGVDDVSVDVSAAQVVVRGSQLHRAELATQLNRLGYPER